MKKNYAMLIISFTLIVNSAFASGNKIWKSSVDALSPQFHLVLNVTDPTKYGFTWSILTDSYNKNTHELEGDSVTRGIDAKNQRGFLSDFDDINKNIQFAQWNTQQLQFETYFTEIEVMRFYRIEDLATVCDIKEKANSTDKIINVVLTDSSCSVTGS